jgi:DNA polymerase III subunit epsilon
MTWLSKFFTSTPHSSQSNVERMIVLDLETTGLDSGTDSVISISALALHGSRIVFNDSLDMIVRPRAIGTRNNALIHGIGHGAQFAGLTPETALKNFLDYSRSSTLIAFHAQFDAAFIGKATHAYLGLRHGAQWIDAADVCKAAWPEITQRGAKSLDDWLRETNTTNPARHRAWADTLATAMLMQKAMVRLRVSTSTELMKVVRAGKWLG